MDNLQVAVIIDTNTHVTHVCRFCFYQIPNLLMGMLIDYRFNISGQQLGEVPLYSYL